MKEFSMRVLIIWSFIFLAFFLGSGLKWVSDWPDYLRYPMIFVMIFSFIPMGVDSIKSK